MLLYLKEWVKWYENLIIPFLRVKLRNTLYQTLTVRLSVCQSDVIHFSAQVTTRG